MKKSLYCNINYILKEELNNLVYAIDWAKTDTINCFIVSEYETE